MNLEINGNRLEVELCPGPSAEALTRLLQNGPMTLPMKDFANIEKFGNLGTDLPGREEYMTVEPGDVILSEGHLLVIYYAPNSWNYTRLGRVLNVDEEQLKRTLGKGDVVAKIWLGEKEGGTVS